jgi:predicted dehydrogenase
MGHKNDMWFEINGEKGAIRFYWERMNELLYYNAEDPEGYQGFRLIQATESIHPYMKAWWPVGHVIGYENTFVDEFYDFFESISNDRPCKPDFYDGMKCSQIMEAVDLSIAENSWVEVDSL